MNKRSPILAGIFSFFIPGLGELYCGKLLRAIIILSIYTAFLIIYFNILIGFYFVLKFGWLIGLGISSLIAFDAIMLAVRLNDYHLRFFNKVLVYTSYSLLFFAIIGTLYLLQSSYLIRYRSFNFPEDSMNMTLLPNDKIMVDHWYYLNNPPAINDIIIFKRPESDRFLIKRIIAVGEGELLKKANTYFFNGRQLQYDNFYIDPNYNTYPELIERANRVELYRMKSDSIFVIGDNSLNSRDSRDYGPIPKADILGKIVYIYESTDKIKEGYYFQ